MTSSSVSLFMRRTLTLASKQRATITPSFYSYCGRAMASKMHLSTNAFAVDSPEGEVDGHLKEEMMEINALIDDAAAIETGVLRQQIIREHDMEEALAKDSQKFFAVDSPDGDSDGHVAEEMEEIKHIIDDAAVLEKGELLQQILRRQKLEEEMAKEHARDPERDW